jgi:hypothetical protein
MQRIIEKTLWFKEIYDSLEEVYSKLK